MKVTREEVLRLSKRYLKVVEWSEEDACFVGSAPPLIGHSCHGKTEVEVLAQLQHIVEEWVELYLREGKPLPEDSLRKEYSGKFVVRVDPGLHRKIALKAQARGESLNQFISEVLART